MSRSEDRDEENAQIAAEIPIPNNVNEIPRDCTMNRNILEFTMHSEYTLGRRTPMPPAVKEKSKKRGCTSGQGSIAP